MDETTNDLLRQLVALQQETVANQKTVIEMNANSSLLYARIERRQKFIQVIGLLVIIIFVVLFATK